MPAHDHTPMRRFRLDDARWAEFGRVVGERERSADLRAYVDWRIAHPDAKLPRPARGSHPQPDH